MKKIDIPFGASDSEAYYEEIIIPEGFEAIIQDGKVIIRKKELDGERIRKALLEYFGGYYHRSTISNNVVVEDVLAWLEKQVNPIGKLQLSEELYEHIRNTCACIDDALSSETLADIKDYLSMAEHSANSAFDMIEKQGKSKWTEDDVNTVQAILYTVRNSGFNLCCQVTNEKMCTWLMSLKQRIEEQ